MVGVGVLSVGSASSPAIVHVSVAAPLRVAVSSWGSCWLVVLWTFVGLCLLFVVWGWTLSFV